MSGTGDSALHFHAEFIGGDMDRDHYRRKAMECLAAAERSREPVDRIELLSIAQNFIRLATYAASQRGAGSFPEAASAKTMVGP
jgi:hypothetical protein